MARRGHGKRLDSPGVAEKLTDNGKGRWYMSEQEANGSAPPEEKKQVDKYGFTGGTQQSLGDL